MKVHFSLCCRRFSPKTITRAIEQLYPGSPFPTSFSNGFLYFSFSCSVSFKETPLLVLLLILLLILLLLLLLPLLFLLLFSFSLSRYSVVVRAENRLGEGPPSSPAHFLTLEEGSFTFQLGIKSHWDVIREYGDDNRKFVSP